MTKSGEAGRMPRCSFCGMQQKEVARLIAGGGVYICDRCVDLCCEILSSEGFRPRAEVVPSACPTVAELAAELGLPGGTVAELLWRARAFPAPGGGGGPSRPA
jgi:hypothetical protein